MRTLWALRAASAARLPFQVVKLRFSPLKPKQISFRFGERDRLGRTIRRPAEWLGDGSGLPAGASYRDYKRLRPEAKGSPESFRGAPRNGTPTGTGGSPVLPIFRTSSEFKKQVANLPQAVELGTGWFGFLFIHPCRAGG